MPFFIVVIEPLWSGDRMYKEGDRLELLEKDVAELLKLGVLKFDETKLEEKKDHYLSLSQNLSLSQIVPEEAILLIQAETSLDKLNQWAINEKRSPVKTAIKSRIAALNASPTNP